MVDENTPAPARSGIYYSDSLIIYGVKLNSEENYGRFSIGQGGSELRLQLFSAGVEQPNTNYSIVLTYGYAFDGHCYRLDSNRIFIVTGPRDETPVGCGFDSDPNPGPLDPAYRMWRIRSSTELLEIATDFGDAKKLILDANLPGRRSPTAYSITQSMAHRDGRLTRD